jgi:nucleoside-diphosphate-sugar epimerase
MTDPSAAVLLTGATGFIGFNVLRQLLRGLPEKPWLEVKALVRTAEAGERVRALGAQPVLGDLLEPTPALLEALGRARYVVHCAQPGRGAGYDLRPQLDRTLLRALDPGRVARIIYVCGSSYIGCAEGSALIDESAPPQPFGVSPFFEEALTTLRAAKESLDYAVAFVGGVYGRGSWFLDAYLRAIAAGEPIVVKDPAPLWPYIHVEDCARAIERLLTAGGEDLAALGREFIVVDDEPTPMDTFIEEVFRAVGRPPNLVRLGADSLRAQVAPLRFSYLNANMPHSNARLRRLGFSCRYPTVREGLKALDLAAAPAG